MAAAKYNLIIEQNATFSLEVTWKDPANTPIDLTGYRIRFQVRTQVEAANTLLSFDSGDLDSGMTIGDLDDSGVISIKISDEVTRDLDFVAGSYDLTAESAGGEVYRVMEGRVTLHKAVTR
jgi:hypothetical protein